MASGHATGYTAGGAVAAVGGVITSLVVARAGPHEDLATNGYYLLGLVAIVVGVLVLIFVGLDHLPPATPGQVISASVSAQPTGDQVVRYELLPNPREAALVVTISMGYAIMRREAKEWHPHMIQLKADGYAAAPATGEPVTLMWARGKVQLDDGDWEDVEARIGQKWDKRLAPPEDFNYPPIVKAGKTIEIDWSFHVHAPTTEEFPGAVIQPRTARAKDVVVVDQLGRSYPADKGTIDYGPCMWMDHFHYD